MAYLTHSYDTTLSTNRKFIKLWLGKIKTQMLPKDWLHKERMICWHDNIHPTQWSMTTPFIILQGLHPRLITEGFDLAKKKALEVGFGKAIWD